MSPENVSNFNAAVICLEEAAECLKRVAAEKPNEAEERRKFDEWYLEQAARGLSHQLRAETAWQGWRAAVGLK